MKLEGFSDLVVWLLIVAGGLVTAYVSFGILNSQASAQLQQYSVGGAIAGALISWGVLLSVYLQLRGSSNELRELRNRTEELQHKLIRGAPRPHGFETEVDERQRIVLARPEDWEPKGGTIFDLEMPTEKMNAEDTFPPAFRCYFGPIDKSTPPSAAFAKELEEARNASAYVHSYSTEIVSLGGELSAVESLKVIARQFVQIKIKKSRETGQIERHCSVITGDEFTGRLFTANPREVRLGKPIQVKLTGYGLRQGGSCYVRSEKRETQVVGDTEAVVTLTQDDVAYPDQIDLAWENPEVTGLWSNKLVLLVRADVSVGDHDKTNEVPEHSEKSVPLENAETHESTVTKQETQVDETRVVFQEVVRMRVYCYNEPLKRIYIFEFWDDTRDFNQSSAVFNQVLSSVRFLN